MCQQLSVRHTPAQLYSLLARVQNAQGFICLNAEVLNTGTDLWLGYDDEVSMLRDPDLSRGRLFDFEPNPIISDWPWALPCRPIDINSWPNALVT